MEQYIFWSVQLARACSVLVNLNPVRYTLCLYSLPFINPPKTLYKVAQAQASNVSIYCLVFFLSGMCLQLYMLHCVVMLVTKMWINITVTVNLSKLLGNAWFSVAQNQKTRCQSPEIIIVGKVFWESAFWHRLNIMLASLFKTWLPEVWNHLLLPPLPYQFCCV